MNRVTREGGRVKVSSNKKLVPPYPWFGGKRKIAPRIWQALGDVERYIEPFAGGAATLLARPDWHVHRDEVINDWDAFIPNFWRAVKADPEAVARAMMVPRFESEFHARNALWRGEFRTAFTELVEGDPDFYDAKIAGWWCWTLRNALGSTYASRGPWVVRDRRLVKVKGARSGMCRSVISFTLNDRHLYLSRIGEVARLIEAISSRLTGTICLSGDWQRCLKNSATAKYTSVGIFLDPPYSDASADPKVYQDNDLTIASKVREWCAANGGNPAFRIVLAGYEGEHNSLEELGWRKVEWTPRPGYGNQRRDGVNENRSKERLWLSPHCLPTDDVTCAPDEQVLPHGRGDSDQRYKVEMLHARRDALGGGDDHAGSNGDGRAAVRVRRAQVMGEWAQEVE